MALNVIASLDPSTQQRIRLLTLLWLGRLFLLWLLLYPVFRPLSASPLLHSSSTDRNLLRCGGESLLALIDADAGSLAALSTAMCFLCVAAAGLTLTASSLTWVATTDPQSVRDVRLWKRVLGVLPAFALVSASSVVIAVGLIGLWLELFPLVGATLSPWLGERRTDFVQLFLIASLVAILAVLCVLSDMVRGVLVVDPKAWIQAVRAAARSYRAYPIRITLHAFARFGLSLSLHLINGWLIAKNGWLTASSMYCCAALATTECAALSAIWLRLDWIGWISKLVGAEASLSQRSRQ